MMKNKSVNLLPDSKGNSVTGRDLFKDLTKRIIEERRVVLKQSHNDLNLCFMFVTLRGKIVV